MTDVLTPRLDEALDDGKPARTVTTAGAVTFADLAWSHYWWEQARWAKQVDPNAQAEYVEKLEAFQDAEGKIVHAYWSTKNASAVALTEQPVKQRKWWIPDVLGWFRLREDDREIRLHRVTDWVTRGEPEIAELLHVADLLAIRISEVLRGVSERIAMRWILGVQEHLLGFIERSADETPAERRKLIRAQWRELRKVERYYHEAASQASRIVYFSGMLLGALAVALLAGIAAVILWRIGLFDSRYAEELGLLFLCFGAGATGSLVSVMTRMRSRAFSLPFEVGRPLVRRLGLFRPAIGAIFGLALYVLLQSGLLLVQLQPANHVYYFAIAGFLAGFSERWTKVTFAAAQRTLTKGRRQEEDDEDEDDELAEGR
jgi:hypothetical protein